MLVSEVISITAVPETSFGEKGEQTVLTVYGYDSQGNKQDITSESWILIKSLDENTIGINGNIITFRNEGTGIVKTFALGTVNGIETENEFICHDTFFRDSYLDYLMASFDSVKIRENKRMKVVFDVLMTFIDIMFAYGQDLKSIKDINGVKSKFLPYVGRNLGFERNSGMYVPSEMHIFNELYRELLKNFTDLIRLRGTKLSYELFFGALGYDIEIDEFWWNGEGMLIQINDSALEDELFGPESPLDGRRKSTYYSYTTEGVLSSGEEIAFPDPRRFGNPDNSVLKNSKSNWLRPLLFSRNTDISQNIASMNSQKRQAVFDYLEMLRPGYAQYMPLVISFKASDEKIADPDENVSYVFFRIKELSDLLSEIEDSIVLGGILNIQHYIDSASLFYDSSGIKYDRGFRYDSYALFNDIVTSVIL